MILIYFQSIKIELGGFHKLVKDIIVLSQCGCQSYNDIDTETYSEPSQTSEMKRFAKIVSQNASS